MSYFTKPPQILQFAISGGFPLDLIRKNYVPNGIMFKSPPPARVGKSTTNKNSIQVRHGLTQILVGEKHEMMHHLKMGDFKCQHYNR